MAQPIPQTSLPAPPQTAAAAASKRPTEGPSGTETLMVTGPMTYTWDYACQRPDLRILYEKSKDLLWNARTDLDWSVEVDPGAENVPAHMNPLSETSLWKK